MLPWLLIGMTSGPALNLPASVHTVAFSAAGPSAIGLSSRGPHATDLESV
jgi:hypothetical protein